MRLDDMRFSVVDTVVAGFFGVSTFAISVWLKVNNDKKQR